MLRSYKIAWIAVTLAAALAGCGTAPTERLVQPRSELERAARAMLESGQYRQAAEQYLRLANASLPPMSHRYRLDAISALLDGSDIQGAKSLLAETGPGRVSAALELRRNAQYARIALAERQPERALELLPAQDTGDLPPQVVTEMRVTRASALLQLGHPMAAARERVELELVLTDPDAIRKNRIRLWQIVTKLGRGELARIQISPPDTLGGWLELARVADAHSSGGEGFLAALEGWRRRFPGHPATESIVPDLMRIGEVAPFPYRHVALLLPLQGPFAEAAEAVRDGFLAAWFSETQADRRPIVSIHDTGASDIRAAYDAAMNAGAEFIVGPLEKTSVGDLASTAPLPRPTLALNYVEEAFPSRKPGGRGEIISVSSQSPSEEPIYQFALSPEMEARQVAERAWYDGHRYAAMLTPEGTWGERVARAFRAAWEELGGVVVEHQVYPNAVRKMPQAVKALLNIDESMERRRILERQLRRKVEFQPRRRQDMDFVFMAAFPPEARQLRPQLKFHHASRVPVYATSHVYSGVQNSAADRDLDGIRFGDMPWVLPSPGPGSQAQQRVRRAWPEAAAAYWRLYAFGVDAYRIIPHLDRLRLHRFAAFEGQTGRLSVDDSNRVNRQLVWARFEAGIPRLRASATRGL